LANGADTRRQLTAIVILILLLPVLYLCFKWGMADLHAYPVRYAIKDWSRQNPAKPDEVLRLLDKIDTAISYTPENAELLELKARILYQRALLNGLMVNQPLSQPVENDLRSALALHRQASALRPQWAYSWANLDLMKAWLGEFDQEWLFSVEQAKETGPWELSANLAVSESALLDWRNLPSSSQSLALAAMERALLHKPRAVRHLLIHYKLLYPICASLPQSKEQKQVCRPIKQ